MLTKNAAAVLQLQGPVATTITVTAAATGADPEAAKEFTVEVTFAHGTAPLFLNGTANCTVPQGEFRSLAPQEALLAPQDRLLAPQDCLLTMHGAAS